MKRASETFTAIFILRITIYTLLLFSFTSCNSDSDDDPTPPSSVDGYTKSGIFKEWGSSIATVQDHIKNQLEKSEIITNNQGLTTEIRVYLVDTDHTVSYYFESERLVAAVELMHSSKMSWEEIKKQFLDLEALGNRKNKILFYDSDGHTLVTIGKETHNEETYHSIGYIEYDYE